MKKTILLIMFLAPLFLAGQGKSFYRHMYSIKDTFYTTVNTPIYLYVTKNDDFNVPDTLLNFLIKPTLCDYLLNDPSTTKKGTQVIANKDSILYTPPKDFIGEDNFYYGYCDSTDTYIRDTNLVTIYVTLTTSVKDLINKTIVYPNPSYGNINIFTENKASCFVYDHTGFLVDKFEKNEGYYERILDLNNGFYYIVIKDKNKIIYHSKLVIIK